FTMLKKKMIVGLFAILLLAFITSSALAGTTNFDVVAPRFGGTTNTNVTTKNTTTQQWEVNVTLVGANKTVEFRPYEGSSAVSSSWISGTSASYINAPYSPTQSIGDQIYLKIKSLWYEPVSVQVTGTFNSN